MQNPTIYVNMTKAPYERVQHEFFLLLISSQNPTARLIILLLDRFCRIFNPILHFLSAKC